MRVMILLLALASALTSASDNAAISPQSAVGHKPQAVADGAESITIPQMLSYQGRLTDTLGLPVADTLYAVRFRLYAQPTGGTQFWEEDQQVRTNVGLFSTLLGSVTPIGSVSDAGALYIGMSVEGGAELAPRLRIASAAYAYLTARASDADLLQGKDTTGLDVRYVNEAQASSVTGAMLVDGTVLTVDVGDTAVTMAKLARAGATAGQVVKWTGSAWAPGQDNTGGGSGVTNVYQDTGIICVPNPITSSGNVKLDLSYGDSRYVNEAQANSVTSGMIADGNVTSADIRDTTVNTADLKDAAVTMPKINQAGATSGQVIKWTGSAWAPGNDSAGGSGDSAWVRGGDSVLYTVHALGLAKGGSANALLGPSAAYHTNFGFRCTTGLSGQDRFHIAIGGGKNNVASASYSTIAGGQVNRAEGADAAIGGGSTNAASGTYSVVSGGQMNGATGSFSTVCGGRSNSVPAVYGAALSGIDNAAGDSAIDTAAVIAGGQDNAATAKFATVGGGRNDSALGYYSTVGGGQENTASGDFAVIAGGLSNAASGTGPTVGGGSGNTASGSYSTVGGGTLNAAPAPYGGVGSGQDNEVGNAAADTGAAVAGGCSNNVTYKYGYIGGGKGNWADGGWSTVSGGSSNRASSHYSTVGGGYSNRALDYYATVAGGYCDTASGNSSFVTGAQNVVSGDYSTIAGGSQNTVSGEHSVIAGGTKNHVSGNWSFAFGRGVTVSDTNLVVLFEADTFGHLLLNREQYSNGARIIEVGTNTDNGCGAYLSSGGIWVDAGLRRLNWQRSEPLDGDAVLERIAGLDVAKREYKNGSQCVAPDAAEFSKALGITTASSMPGDGAISPLDVASVALVAIKELTRKLDAQQMEIEALKAELRGR